MSDSYAAALRAAAVDLTYDSHPGYHDWNNFRAEFQAAVSLGAVRAGGGGADEWVNDTVATHGTLVGRRLSLRRVRPTASCAFTAATTRPAHRRGRLAGDAHDRRRLCPPRPDAACRPPSGG